MKICVIATAIKSYKSIIKKKKKKHDKVLSLIKSNLNNVEILISKVSIDSSISHDESVLLNKVPQEFDDMKEEIKHFNDK